MIYEIGSVEKAVGLSLNQILGRSTQIILIFMEKTKSLLTCADGRNSHGKMKARWNKWWNMNAPGSKLQPRVLKTTQLPQIRLKVSFHFNNCAFSLQPPVGAFLTFAAILVVRKILIDLQRFWLHGSRDGNRTGSGRGAPLPTPPRLFKSIPIPVPFKKLNGAGWGGAGRVCYIPIPAPFSFLFNFNFNFF